MTGNGVDAYAALAARVAELEAALVILTRRWDGQLLPRLAQIDADLSQHAQAITEVGDAVLRIAIDRAQDPGEAPGKGEPTCTAGS